MGNESALHVLNPGGGDPAKSFVNGPGRPEDPGHPPVNFHAFAACTRGVFARSLSDLPTDTRQVLLLLRPKHLGRCLKHMQILQRSGIRVWISWKESGSAQVAEALSEVTRWQEFQKLAAACDGFVSATQDLVSLYQMAGGRRGRFLPTPYPLEYEAWDFSKPLSEREGVFLGTREWNVPARNHLLALCDAGRLKTKVTVINTGGGAGRRYLAALPFPINIVEGPLPYGEYLHLMASHRLVFQLDAGAVPGQVAGDALLCRMPCVGGNGAIDRLAFPALCGLRPNHIERAALLLTDELAWVEAVHSSQDIARATLAFEPVARQITEMCA